MPRREPDVARNRTGSEHRAEPGRAETSMHRARLLAVLAFPDTNELEVHLILDGRRTIGRAVSTDGLVGAVEATLAAVHEIGAPFEPHAVVGRARSRAATTSASWSRSRSAASSTDAPIDYGLAAGASPIDAAGAIHARRAEPPARPGALTS